MLRNHIRLSIETRWVITWIEMTLLRAVGEDLERKVSYNQDNLQVKEGPLASKDGIRPDIAYQIVSLYLVTRTLIAWTMAGVCKAAACSPSPKV